MKLDVSSSKVAQAQRCRWETDMIYGEGEVAMGHREENKSRGCTGRDELRSEVSRC